MVDESCGQIYTIEGVAAAILMVTTTYLVLSTTIILTPGETHITDMQLEQLGYDALSVMDTPSEYGTQSRLSDYIQNNKKIEFNQYLLQLLNTRTDLPHDTLSYNASVFYRNSTDSLNYYSFSGSQYYRQNSVKVTRWVGIPDAVSAVSDMRSGDQTVLLEVLIWRD